MKCAKKKGKERGRKKSGRRESWPSFEIRLVTAQEKPLKDEKGKGQSLQTGQREIYLIVNNNARAER